MPAVTRYFLLCHSPGVAFDSPDPDWRLNVSRAVKYFEKGDGQCWGVRPAPRTFCGHNLFEPETGLVRLVAA